jgi:Domain of unknown function (DUF4091)
VRLCALSSILLAAAGAWAAELQALPEHIRPDPFGGVLKSDQKPGAALVSDVTVTAPRGGFVSFQLVARMAEGGAYVLNVKMPPPLEADLFREWFHLTRSDRVYRPDALIPVSAPYRSQIPAPDNHIEKQTVQAFWVDIWVPHAARAGSYMASAELEAGTSRVSLSIRITVLGAEFPEKDAVTIDHNSYGSSWLADDYPELRNREGAKFFESDSFFALIHAYHRIFYEHRGTFHQLGYGHGGKTGPEFAPALEGSGRSRRIKDWSLFDRHYGPLFDGSAFVRTRRGPQPIPFVYLPINPDWPASSLWWGEPGYEAEFVNVVAAMERHFRERGWTHTNFEFFFNHKKRYKAYWWDGDETRFANDLPMFVEYSRLLKKAVPADTPVKFVFRADSSWMMERQFKELAGIIKFWVVGGTEFSWLPYAPKMLRDRGDIVWFYSGPPNVAKVSSSITLFPVKAWIWGIDGYIHWLTVSAGKDPWFDFDGGETTLVYPGERFGVTGPIPSIRLKLQRNCAQDLALLRKLAESTPLPQLKAEVARRYNATSPADWWNPRPPLADTPPDRWNNADIDEAPRPKDRFFRNLDAGAWQNVREYILKLAAEAK